MAESVSSSPLPSSETYLNSEAHQGSTVRYQFIDVLRGIAAVAVLISHGTAAAGLGSNDGFGAKWFNFGEFGVITFFLVSGFVIPLSLERIGSVGNFWISRVLRIYPLYLFILGVTFLSVSTGLYAPEYYKGDYGLLSALLSHLIFLQGYIGIPDYVSGSWTLSVEMIWYISFSVFFLLSLNFRNGLISILAASALLLVSASAFFISTRLPMGRFAMLVTCVVGLLFFRLHSNRLNRYRFCNYLALLIICILFALWVGFARFPVPGNPLIFRCVAISWSSAYLLFIVAYYFRSSPLLSNRVLLRFGTYSYSIYLVHGISLNWLEATPYRGWTFMALLASSTLIISWFTYTYIERPAMTLARRLYARSSFPSN